MRFPRTVHLFLLTFFQAITPEDIRNFFSPIMEQACTLVDSFRKQTSRGLHLQNAPTITVSTVFTIVSLSYTSVCCVIHLYHYPCAYPGISG